MKKIIFILCILFSLFAQAGEDAYLIFDPSRSDAWTHDKLKACWNTDPGTMGDRLQSIGNFETAFTVAHATCTNCCATCWCSCVGVGSVISQETSILYKNDNALKAVMALAYPAGSIQFGWTDNFEINKSYLVTFWAKSGAGTEDGILYTYDSTYTVFYNPVTDTWGGGTPYMSLANIPTTWTRYSLYVRSGAASWPGAWITFAFGGGAGDTIYIDDFEIQELGYDGGVNSFVGNYPLTNGVTSDPVWGQSKRLQQRPGFGPAYHHGVYLDGSDYLSRADDNAFDPALNNGDFSVGCRNVVPTASGANQYIVSHYGASGNRSWALYNATGTGTAIYSNDGTATTSHTGATVFVNNTLQNFVLSYDYTTAGSVNTSNLYYGAITVGTSAVQTGPLFNSTTSLDISGRASGTNLFPGYVGQCCYWDRALTAIEAAQWRSPFFPGTKYKTDNRPTACTNTTPHNKCSYEKCIASSANSCMADGTGTFPVFAASTELVQNNSYETMTDDESLGNFNNITETETVGDGTSNITGYRDDTFHGSLSARLKTTGTTSSATLTSSCITVTAATFYTWYIRARKFVDPCSQVTLTAAWYTDGACANANGTTASSHTLDSAWAVYLNGIAAPAGSNSATLSIVTSAISDVLIDTSAFRARSFFTPWFENPAGTASTSTNLRNYALNNSLSEYIEQKNAYGYAGGFCFGVWNYTDWTGDDGVRHNWFFIAGTSGNNNMIFSDKETDNKAYFTWYNSGATVRSASSAALTSTTWPVGWHYIEGCEDNSSVIKGRHYSVATGAWTTWTNGTPTGTQNGNSANMVVGSNGSSYVNDGYFGPICITPYNAIYPQCRFNGGVPPNNGQRPY